MTKFTKKQKAKYFTDLRTRWQESKALAETAEVKAIIKECQDMGVQASPYSISFTWMDMKAQGLDGLPMIDAKTYGKWKESGFIVKTGEKATLNGITWLKVGKQDDEAAEDKSFLIPKGYKLFHRSQVETLV